MAEEVLMPSKSLSGSKEAPLLAAGTLAVKSERRSCGKEQVSNGMVRIVNLKILLT